MDHRVLRCPVYMLVEQATADQATGKFSVQGVVSVESGEKSAVAVFTQRAAAVRYARATGKPDAQVGQFDDPIDIGHFLQVQQTRGFTHVCINPVGMLPPMIRIADALASLSTAARSSE